MTLYLDNIIFSLQNAGGISVVWKELLGRLLNDPDFDLKFIEYENQNIFRKELDIPIEFVLENSWPHLPLKIERYLKPRFLKKNGLFHSSYYRIAGDKRIGNITTVHDFTYSFFRTGLPAIIHNRQKRNAITNFRKVICVSENTKKDLLQFFPKVKESDVKVIYNGLSKTFDILPFKSESQINQLIPYSSGEFLLYVGDRVSEYKNFKMAASAAKESGKPLVIVGKGPSKKELSYLNELLGKRNNCFVTSSGNEVLNNLYNHALCLVYPSSYEGFGLPVIEAQKAGCPVICGNNSSLPEIGGNGAIFIDKMNSINICEAIRLLLSDSSIKNDLILKGTKNATRFSWDKNYQLTKELYNEVYAEFFWK